MQYTAQITSIPRNFLPRDFRVTNWETLEPYFQDLLNRVINNPDDLHQWLNDLNEIDAVVSEDSAWRQIRMTCDTENKELEDAFTYYVTQIQPRIQPVIDQLNHKLVNNEFLPSLQGPAYEVYLRNVRKNIELFRQENVRLKSEIAVLAQQYGVISGKMTVQIDGQEYTLQQANKFLESPDRSKREEVYHLVQQRRAQDRRTMDDLFNKLVKLRHEVAVNAGFENYRDYKFADLGRFDYKKEDCFEFHEAVRTQILPLVNFINDRKRQKLGLTELRPWDMDAEPAGTKPLRPFETGEELLAKTVACFNRMNPFFGDCLLRMKDMGRLDLESRKGKAPGGYNCPLPESGAPFIFMNAAGQMADVTTMVHEGGHAVHSFLAHTLPLTAFKEYPMEIAEVASMAMELFSMEYWDEFFDDPEELRRAKEYQLERVLSIFPWIAIIDKFQHWVYENPQHTEQERTENWERIFREFASVAVSYEGLEKYLEIGWQRQLHLFEVPFYYIEYGIAQLGAIGLWKQFKENKDQAINNYIKALALGGTRSLPELYEAAGLKFSFAPEHIAELMLFVQGEMKRI